MGGVNVKNTIVERVLQIVAPHPCFGCGKVGSLLCEYCKYDIINEPFVGCISCETASLDGVCEKHKIDIEKAYVVSARTGVVKVLVDGLKFQHVKAAAQTAAQLLHENLPTLPANTVIVPIPTISSHIRQRGYDQTLLIARHFARLRSLEVRTLLKRNSSTVQKQLDKENRRKEAQKAFVMNDTTPLPASKLVVLLDDVVTTGSTVSAAAQLLARHGNPVIVAALAYQPLD